MDSPPVNPCCTNYIGSGFLEGEEADGGKGNGRGKGGRVGKDGIEAFNLRSFLIFDT